MNFLVWLRRERSVVVSPDPATMSLRVAVERQDGTRVVRLVTDLALQSFRGSPYDLVASAFDDPMDRAAIRLLGRAQIDAGSRQVTLMQREPHGRLRVADDRRSAPQGDSGSFGPTAPAALRSPDGVDVLAPPSPRVPLYRPR